MRRKAQTPSSIQALSPQQFEAFTGMSWEVFGENHDADLSDAENDEDQDSVSNRDEETVFFTNPNAVFNRPTTEELRTALLANLVSATTLMNFQHLLSGGDEGDDGEGGGGDTTGTPLQVFSGGGSGVLYGGFSASANFSGGVAPFTFSFSGLPQGVRYDEETHTFSGQPTQEGHTQGSVTVTDAEGASGTAPATYYVAPRAEPPGGDRPEGNHSRQTERLVPVTLKLVATTTVGAWDYPYFQSGWLHDPNTAGDIWPTAPSLFTVCYSNPVYLFSTAGSGKNYQRHVTRNDFTTPRSDYMPSDCDQFLRVENLRVRKKTATKRTTATGHVAFDIEYELEFAAFYRVRP